MRVGFLPALKESLSEFTCVLGCQMFDKEDKLWQSKTRKF